MNFQQNTLSIFYVADADLFLHNHFFGYIASKIIVFKKYRKTKGRVDNTLNMKLIWKNIKSKNHLQSQNNCVINILILSSFRSCDNKSRTWLLKRQGNLKIFFLLIETFTFIEFLYCLLVKNSFLFRERTLFVENWFVDLIVALLLYIFLRSFFSFSSKIPGEILSFWKTKSLKKHWAAVESNKIKTQSKNHFSPKCWWFWKRRCSFPITNHQ